MMRHKRRNVNIFIVISICHYPILAVRAEVFEPCSASWCAHVSLRWGSYCALERRKNDKGQHKNGSFCLPSIQLRIMIPIPLSQVLPRLLLAFWFFFALQLSLLGACVVRCWMYDWCIRRTHNGAAPGNRKSVKASVSNWLVLFHHRFKERFIFNKPFNKMRSFCLMLHLERRVSPRLIVVLVQDFLLTFQGFVNLYIVDASDLILFAVRLSLSCGVYKHVMNFISLGSCIQKLDKLSSFMLKRICGAEGTILCATSAWYRSTKVSWVFTRRFSAINGLIWANVLLVGNSLTDRAIIHGALAGSQFSPFWMAMARILPFASATAIELDFAGIISSAFDESFLVYRLIKEVPKKRICRQARRH